MSFGPDIKELLHDIGTGFTIVRATGNITGEKLLYKTNNQVTKPFIREFFLEASLSYDTAVLVGDLIKFSDNRYFFVANKTSRQFENATFDEQTVLYKCNVSGEVQRQSGEGWNADYQEQSSWVTVSTNEYGLITEELQGNFLEEDDPAGRVLARALMLYVSINADLQPNDRYIAVSGETPFIVGEIDTYRFGGLKVAHLNIDTRE